MKPQSKVFPTFHFQNAWTDQSALLAKISASNRKDVEHLLNFLNFEIEYILRPRSAPIRYGPPRLRTEKRAQSAQRKRPVVPSRYGYPAVRARSSDPYGRKDHPLETHDRERYTVCPTS